jgi:hypothetical protein
MPRKNINKHLRLQILIRDNYKCSICGRPKDEVSLEVDHIIPISKGGTDELNNLAALCKNCNLGKSNYSFSDYTSLTIMPNDIEKNFKFCHDDKIGMFERYHYYCFYRQRGGSLSSNGEFHHSWTITDTEFALSSNQKALETRRIEEEAIIFKENIRKNLAGQRKRLILTEEGLEIL